MASDRRTTDAQRWAGDYAERWGDVAFDAIGGRSRLATAFAFAYLAGFDAGSQRRALEDFEHSALPDGR